MKALPLFVTPSGIDIMGVDLFDALGFVLSWE